MGWTGANIGDFTLMMHDSEGEYIKDRQPKEYYENYMLDLEFVQMLSGWKEPERSWQARERNKKEWDIQIPLLKFGKIKKLKKNYRFEWDDDWNLRHFLWEELEKRDLVVEGYIAISDYYNEDGKNHWKYYYLTSNIGEEPVKLQSPTEGIDILHRVHNCEEHEWILRHGLEFYSEIRT